MSILFGCDIIKAREIVKCLLTARRSLKNSVGGNRVIRMSFLRFEGVSLSGFSRRDKIRSQLVQDLIDAGLTQGESIVISARKFASYYEGEAVEKALRRGPSWMLRHSKALAKAFGEVDVKTGVCDSALASQLSESEGLSVNEGETCYQIIRL